jgi:hypothetical protein
MKAIIEHLLVAVIAVLMAFAGYWLMDWYEGRSPHFMSWHEPGWIVWLSAVSMATWLYLYRISRKLHWLVLPVLGLVSPIIGALLFFPLTFWALVKLWKCALVIFPIGIVTGFLISILTLPFRPRSVLHANA